MVQEEEDACSPPSCFDAPGAWLPAVNLVSKSATSFLLLQGNIPHSCSRHFLQHRFLYVYQPASSSLHEFDSMVVCSPRFKHILPLSLWFMRKWDITLPHLPHVSSSSLHQVEISRSTLSRFVAGLYRQQWPQLSTGRIPGEASIMTSHAGCYSHLWPVTSDIETTAVSQILDRMHNPSFAREFRRLFGSLEIEIVGWIFFSALPGCLPASGNWV